MAFETSYDDLPSGGGLIPEGKYEVIIKYAGEDSTKGGAAYINVTCVIRNDVAQQYKNKYLWYSIWQKKEPTQADIACGGYSSKQINSLSKAANLPNGKKYESLSDWCDELKDKVIKVTVEHDSYDGKTREKVKWTNESKFPQCKHVWKKAEPDIIDDEPAPTYATGVQQDFEEVKGIADEDLPF